MSKATCSSRVGTLEGVSEGDDVVLTWQKPSTDEVNDAVTDDFEAYESFIIDGIGDWTTYDGDGTQTVYFGGRKFLTISPRRHGRSGHLRRPGSHLISLRCCARIPATNISLAGLPLTDIQLLFPMTTG